MNICPSGLMDYSTILIGVQQIVVPGIKLVIPVPVKPPETSLPIILMLHHNFSIRKRASHASFIATN